MMSGELFASAQAQFDTISKEYQTSQSKVHITDLTPVQQGQLRNEMFNLIEQVQLPCFFEAIHVAGFHAHFRRVKAMIKQAKAQRRSHIKLSGNAPHPASTGKALCPLHCRKRTDR